MGILFAVIGVGGVSGLFIWLVSKSHGEYEKEWGEGGPKKH